MAREDRRIGRVRAYEPSDAAAVLAINAENVPAVGEMDEEKLAFFARTATFFVVAENTNDVPLGFLIGLDNDAAAGYTSPNYAHFTAKYAAELAYVDRVAVTESAQGQGLGPAMYNAFEAWAIGFGKGVLAAEVNTIPDNPHSHHFHQTFGFTETGRGRPYGPDEEVAYYEKVLRRA